MTHHVISISSLYGPKGVDVAKIEPFDAPLWLIEEVVAVGLDELANKLRRGEWAESEVLDALEPYPALRIEFAHLARDWLQANSLPEEDDPQEDCPD